MQKVLVTGSAGFIGSCLVKKLKEQNIEVFAATKALLDFTDAVAANETISIFKPDVIVHAGAMSRPDACELNRELAYEVNVTGTRNLLEAAASSKAFFVFLSTDFVFDGNRGMYSEDDQRGAVNYYGETKILAEDEVKQYDAGWCIARTVLVYGPPIDGRQNLVTMVAEALTEGRPLKIFDDQMRTPTFVEDLAEALVTIVLKRSSGIFHISGADQLSPYQIAVKTAAYLGFDPGIIEAVTESDFEQPARRPLRTGFNISRAKALLDYNPVSFEEGLRKSLQDFAKR